MLPTYDDDAPPVEMVDRPKTLRLVPVRWSCGWSTASGRCIRFHCQKSGPCEGYAGDPANG